MSVTNEEDLHERLQLFESTVSHASITWNELEKVCITERSEDFFLQKGDFLILDFVDKSQVESLKKFHESIGEGFSETFILVNYQGKKVTLKCCATKKKNEIKGMWVVLPEKDNSILYLQNAAHDFRSPLGSVLGVVNLMQHSIKTDATIDKEELTTYLDMIKFSADKALNLASEIMELAKIESKEYVLKTEEIVVKDFIQHYLDTHRLLTLKKRIQVQFESRTDASALINESKLTRALDNVVTNSVKFSKEGTTIKFILAEKSGSIVLNIRDQGIGMSKKILDNLFIKFGEAKRNGLNGEPTHGLGMSIVRQIMKLHDGDIKVKSEEMKGTEVELILKKCK